MQFNHNGGKTELQRECGGGVKIKNFYLGITTYVKMAFSFNASMTLIADVWPNPTSVYLLEKETSKITKVVADGAETNLVGFSAVAAVHVDNVALNVSTLVQSVFMSNGQSAGASLAF